MKYNPDKSEKTEPRVQKVIAGKAGKRKKSKSHEIAEMFISDDVHNVKSFVIFDVVIPAIKAAIYDGVVNGLHMSLWGGSDRDRKGSRKNYGDRYISSRDRDRDRDRDRRRIRRINLDELSIDSRGEAEEVLDQMYELLDRYGYVSVADYLDMLGEEHDYTYQKYGWTDLRNAEIKRDRDGSYYIRLPRYMPFD